MPEPNPKPPLASVQALELARDFQRLATKYADREHTLELALRTLRDKLDESEGAALAARAMAETAAQKAEAAERVARRSETRLVRVEEKLDQALDGLVARANLGSDPPHGPVYDPDKTPGGGIRLDQARYEFITKKQADQEKRLAEQDKRQAEQDRRLEVSERTKAAAEEALEKYQQALVRRRQTLGLWIALAVAVGGAVSFIVTHVAFHG